MHYKLKSLADQVIVVTGATSGIGLATCQMAAREGARVVMGARNEATLRKVEQEIRAAGGQVVSCVLDVADTQGIERLADRAVSTFGQIDSWVNNAGVAVFGRMEKVSEKDHRRLFDTNFWGVVNGCMTALRYVRDQGGAIINVGSVLSERSFPLQGMYSASKHAVKGFTEAFRMEVEELGDPVSITLIMPAAVATPYVEHAKNYTDHEFKLPPPLYAPEVVARAILHAAAHSQRDVLVGDAAPAFSLAQKIMPRALDRVSEAVMFDLQKGARKQSQAPDGLHHSISKGKVHCDDPGSPVQPISFYNRGKENPLLALGALALAGAALAWVNRRR